MFHFAVLDGTIIISSCEMVWISRVVEYQVVNNVWISRVVEYQVVNNVEQARPVLVSKRSESSPVSPGQGHRHHQHLSTTKSFTSDLGQTTHRQH